MAEKTTQANIAFETVQFMLAFVLIMLCNNQDSLQHSITKIALSFISIHFLKMSFIFSWLEATQKKKKKKPQLTILIKQVDRESISFLNIKNFPEIVEMIIQVELKHD